MRVNDDESETDWIVFRRPIRVLDWDIWGKHYLSQEKHQLFVLVKMQKRQK